jgi:hypothetical protein
VEMREWGSSITSLSESTSAFLDEEAGFGIVLGESSVGCRLTALHHPKSSYTHFTDVPASAPPATINTAPASNRQ